MVWLIAVLVAAPTAAPVPHAIVWGEGKASETERAIEAWFDSRDARRLPPLTLGAGFPQSIPDRRRDAPGGHELAIIGICEADLARQIAAALRRLNPGVRTAPFPGASVGAACPRLTRLPAASLLRLLEEQRPRASLAAERARARVALCSFDAAERRARYGDDNLCRGLWGLDCATYAELVLFARPQGDDPCPFLLDDPQSTRILSIELDVATLSFCDAENAAYVFSRRRGSELQRPAAILCGHGPGYATQLGQPHAVGPGACLEYVRSFGAEGSRAGLLCYAPSVADSGLTVDDLTLVDERGDDRYGIAVLGDERIICLEQGALRLSERGLERLEPRPRACEAIALDLPLPRVSP